MSRLLVINPNSFRCRDCSDRRGCRRPGPFLPLGEYHQPTAYRNSITGVLNGAAVFWTVRPA